MASIDQKNYNKKFYQLFNWLFAIIIFKILIIFSEFPLINHRFYENYIKIVEQSLVPYKDFHYEYPPIFALISSLPFGLIKFKNGAEYLIYFQFFTLIFDILAMQISLKILTKLNDNKLDKIKTLNFYLAWTIFSIFLSSIIYHCLEFVIIFIFVLNILYFNISDNKYNFKFYLMSIIGIFTKIISSLNLPLAIFFHSYKKSKNFSEFIFLTFKNSFFLALTIVLIILIFEYFFNFQMIKNFSLQYFRENEIFSIIGNYIFITNKILGIKSEIYLAMSMSIKPNDYLNVFLATHLFKLI